MFAPEVVDVVKAGAQHVPAVLLVLVTPRLGARIFPGVAASEQSERVLLYLSRATHDFVGPASKRRFVSGFAGRGRNRDTPRR